MKINWFPGHMKKTLETVEKNKPLVDFVIEIIDARIPGSSQNPSLTKILEDKPRLILLNKTDLAETSKTEAWVKFLSQKENVRVIGYQANDPGSKKQLIQEARFLNQHLYTRWAEKGMKPQVLRAMVVGIPNSGKSTFINTFVGKKSAKTGNRPGVTKTHQWVRMDEDLQLLDTPGVLWPRFETERQGENLAFTGAIRDEILDEEELAFALLKRLLEEFPGMLSKRYGVEESTQPIDVYEEIGRRRGFKIRGGDVDFERTAKTVLDEFRKGLLGPITLETVGEIYGKDL